MAGKNVWCLIADAGGARTEYPVAASPTRIGRDGANDIELSGLEVSRFHAELFPGEKTLKIVDLGSDNGVLVDGLPAGKEAEVEEGQEIGIGLHRLRVERRREARGGRQDTLLLTADAVRHLRLRPPDVAPDDPEDAADHTARVGAAVEPAGPGDAALGFVLRPDEGTSGSAVGIGTRDFFIGRAADCHLVIADHDVSRRHARIVWRQGTHYVYDLGSANGIRVNGAKVRGVALAPGDLLEIGAERWRYLGATDAPPPSAASGPRTPRARNFPRWVYWALGAAAVLLVVLFFGSRP